ncbi:hypothetical protein SCP_0400490 [Sparassis crispa]|uniref:Uncharacterized protein n=1 Tax=Sparassis crispa TaxID=139825 RepID=A0A401GHP9_9APHY|nr:hypothetical protein SCP_0400490 [Sparassis crispa]GBE81678.1 hypothetical protein SCP_0400490 [Sparassis crispa]
MPIAAGDAVTANMQFLRQGSLRKHGFIVLLVGQKSALPRTGLALVHGSVSVGQAIADIVYPTDCTRSETTAAGLARNVRRWRDLSPKPRLVRIASGCRQDDHQKA